MKNVLEFESFDPLNEASLVPVYNNFMYFKNPLNLERLNIFMK